jgi:hypothetical protein
MSVLTKPLLCVYHCFIISAKVNFSMILFYIIITWCLMLWVFQCHVGCDAHALAQGKLLQCTVPTHKWDVLFVSQQLQTLTSVWKLRLHPIDLRYTESVLNMSFAVIIVIDVGPAAYAIRWALWVLHRTACLSAGSFIPEEASFDKNFHLKVWYWLWEQTETYSLK